MKTNAPTQYIKGDFARHAPEWYLQSGCILCPNVLLLLILLYTIFS